MTSNQTTALTQTERLLSLIDQFKDTPILLVGDMMLDHYVWGKVDRISPEAPVVVVQVTEESERPGGAALVAHNLVQLGAKVYLGGFVGDDSSGRALRNLLDGLGINTEALITDPERPTTVKTRVIAHSQQVVRVDREKVGSISGELGVELSKRLAAVMPNTKAMVISDYAKGAITETLFDFLDEKKSQLGFGKYPVVIDPKAPNFGLYRNATVVKPNRAEASRAANMEIPNRAHAISAGEILLRRWGCEIVLITLGEDGMVLVSDSPGLPPAVEIDTMARDVFDVSGAGDTVNAVFTLALATGASPGDAARLANHAAGLVVAEVGTVAVTAQDLRAAVLISEEE
jgi:rfaE bifunctional protein kinase chain/domain